MFASIQKFVMSAMVFLLAFTTACGEGGITAVEPASRVTITGPQNGLVDGNTAFPMTFAVWVCSSGTSEPRIVAEIPNQVSTSGRARIASVVGVNTEPSLTQCSDGRRQYVAFVQIQGHQVGVTQGAVFLESDPSVRITFLVNVRYDDGQKG